MKFTVFCLIIAASIIMYSCSSSKDTSAGAPQTGEYSYTISDSIGNKLIVGTLNIIAVDKGNFNGTYKKLSVYDSTFTAYNILRGGDFSGTYKTNGEIGFNMNPKMADNNVFIGGKLIGGVIDGTWTHSTMSGTKSKGKFNAVLQ